jgi:magnesium-protoporphyrin O-methyltransferase
MAEVSADTPLATGYAARRGVIETYFNHTALDAWTQLTSDKPVSGIRATVRAGRDRMRATLLSWLPAALNGLRVLDAGCGSGALSIAAATAGAHVTAVDISGGLVNVARSRVPAALDRTRIDFHVGDMLDVRLGVFDHAVAMDSLIHYETPDVVTALAALAPRVRGSIVFTFAPRTPALALMHAVGRLFPRGDRAPAIVPTVAENLQRQIAAHPAFATWEIGRTARIDSGFYRSQALELRRR